MTNSFLVLLVLTCALLAEDRTSARERIAGRGIEATRPAPPAQPKSGPGGSDYPHAGVRETEHGEGGTQFWILEPARPTPKQAPLVIFLHGYSAMQPDSYRGWIEHLARRGNIVVYPRYQKKLLTPPAEYFPNVAASVRMALSVLRQPRHVAPDLEMVAVVGHSAGGVEAANYAILATKEKLPVPKALMLVTPGQGPERGVKMVPLEDCEKIPAETRLLVVIAEADGFVGSGCAREIWQQTKHVRDRSFVTVQSDDYGSPPLRASHLSPVSWTPEVTDALDWFGYWKLFDGLTAAAFAGRNYTVDVNMGNWSDGLVVKPLKVER
jgi:pimeloyl-ACP methyl ester carboxylesterase